MSKQKKLYTVSKEDRDAFHDALDKIMDTGDAHGFMMLCCTFQQDGIAAATCLMGTMNGQEIMRAIAKCGGHLLEEMAQRRAETSTSEVVQ